MKKRILCIFMALVMVVALMPERAWASGMATVSYIDYDENGNKCSEMGKSNSYSVISSDTTTWNEEWYVANSSVTIASRITVSGDIRLILCDDVTLEASQGIYVPNGASLTIYSEEKGTGKLNATGSDNCAGIGGNSGTDCGTITINGGVITAKGGDKGAGIGGGYNYFSSLVGKIIVNGGTVIANGASGASGIGGSYGGAGAEVIINGGNVTATGLDGGVGIGNGKYSQRPGKITINGGTVTAKGYVGIGLAEGSAPSSIEKVISNELTVMAGADETSANKVNTFGNEPYVHIGHIHNDVEFEPWFEADSLPEVSGNYWLKTDVTLSATWTAPSGTEGSPAVTNLCLNGHVIKVSEESVASKNYGMNVIKVPNYAELNIYDCDNATEHYFNVGTDGLWTLTTEKTDTTKTVVGGVITGGSYDEHYGYDQGGGIFVNGGTLNLYGGNIVGNATIGESLQYGGGGVYVKSGAFNMSGGSIKGNRVASHGGGVYVYGGKFTMTGGNISENVFDGHGGGVAVIFNGIFEMTGGEITGNYTIQNLEGRGSGVTVYKDNWQPSVNNGKFIMTGGTISGNISGTYGSAIELNDNVFLGGTAKIKDNVDANGNAVNIMLDGYTALNIGTGTGEGKNGVAVPEEGMCIHLGLDKYVYELPIAATTNGTADDAKYFVPDNASDYEVIFETDHLEFGKKDTPIDIPTVNTGLVYDGSVKTGVDTGTGYTLTSATATNAGNYTAVATLADGYIWSDGTKDAKQIEWSVAKAMVIAPTIAGKMYTGTKLIADVYPDSYYEVTQNDGGIEVGSYDVVITLKDSVNYKWLDSTEAARTLKFEITERPEYNVTGYSDEFGNRVTANVQTAPSGEKVALTVIPADEYLFKSLNVTTVSGERVEADSDNTFTMPAEAVVVNAVFEKEIKKYTVSFSMNGQGTQVDSQTVIKGQTATRPATPAAVAYTFNGWFADDSLTTAFDFAAPITADMTVYAKWAKNQAPAPAPGPAPAPTPDVPAVTDTYSVPVKGENTVKVEAKLRDGNADVKEITLKDIDKIFSEASEEEAKPVTVDLSDAKQEINSVTLTKKSFENIAGAVADESNPADSLEVKFTDADMILDSRAVKAVNEQAKGDKISLIVEEGKDIELNKAQQKAIKNENVVTVADIRIISNGKEIHELDGGSALIKIKPDDRNLLNGKNYKVKYVAEDGTMEIMETTTDGSRIIFKVGHFSKYVIVYDENAENEVKNVKAPYIKLSKTIGLGNTFSMAVTNVADDANVKYSSSDRSVATVDGNGVITAVGIGRCTVKGVIKQHGTTYKFAVAVTVKDTGKGNRSIKADECLTPNSLTPLFNAYKAVNTARPFKLNIKRLAEDAVVTFTSEDETVAEVSKDGVITGLKKGYTGISVYVKQNGQTLQYRVFVRVSDK